MPNQERIGTFGEKENNRYLNIHDADIIELGKMKEKQRKEKRTSEERVNAAKSSTPGEIS